jgi:myo-inositol 2-dehydrogenase/D-chiro-inositol 1-dehydrogenase
MLNIGVIGTGMIGQDHIRRLTEALAGATVVAVSDVDQARAQAVAARLPAARAFATGQALIEDDRVDAVVVASWGPTHEEYLLACLAAGKPVFCEKPLATTEEACARIVDAEVACGRRLIQVGFMRRFDRAYRVLKETVDSGAIGAPLIFHSVHRNASVPSHYTSDMAVVDTAVHDIDVARWLLDDEVAAVSVVAARPNRRGGGLRDPLLVLLEMRSGALVDIEVSVNIGYGYDIRGEVSGETGTASLAESNAVVVKRDGAFAGRVPEDWRERFVSAYDDEFRAWIGAAAAGGAAGPSAWDGYAATVVTDAGLAALGSGARTAVVMREKPALYA